MELFHENDVDIITTFPDESAFQFEDDVAEHKFFHTSVVNRLQKPERSKLFEVNFDLDP